MADEIKCPKCQSTQISAVQKGFSVGKAAAGAIITGGIGLVAGLHGSKDIEVVCLNCGTKWNPKKRDEERSNARAQAAANYTRKWKDEFYSAYESGKLAEADAILQIQRGSMLKEKGLDGMYKHLKSEDKTEAILKFIIIGIFFIIVIWFVSCLT